MLEPYQEKIKHDAGKYLMQTELQDLNIKIFRL